MTTDPHPDATWQRVLALDELPENRVTSVSVGEYALAITRYQGQYGAFDERCPHQGGPLGQGSIERGWLRCPWHGYDCHPLTGEPPEGFSDAPACFPVEERADGIYVAVPPAQPEPHTVST